jgi:regulator of replication initiation timing
MDNNELNKLKTQNEELINKNKLLEREVEILKRRLSDCEAQKTESAYGNSWTAHP